LKRKILKVFVSLFQKASGFQRQSLWWGFKGEALNDARHFFNKKNGAELLTALCPIIWR